VKPGSFTFQYRALVRVGCKRKWENYLQYVVISRNKIINHPTFRPRLMPRGLRRELAQGPRYSR
jgi:hypothetical protein